MRRLRLILRRLASLGVLTAAIAGCSTGEARQITKEILFPLELGILESNLNVFAFEGMAPPINTRVIMRNGIFAISDGASNKVMEFSSYGDLLSLYYQPESNPLPITLRTRTEGEQETTVVNKLAHPYPFQRVGDIAFTKGNMLLVQDSVPESRIIYDDSRGVYLNHVVLRFDPQGEYQDYIGQEGIGGTAFPSIQAIRVTARNHMVVTSQLSDAVQVFWYDSLGDLLYSVEFENQHLPRFERDGYQPVLAGLHPHMSLPEILLKIDFYPLSVSQGGPADQSIVERVYTFDLASGAYSASFDLPRIVRNESIQYLYELLGMDEKGVLYLLGRLTEIQHQLLLMDDEGRVLYRGVVELDDTQLVDRDLRVNDQGTLVGLLIYDEVAEVVWWRTDRLVSAQ